jgi:flagellar hook assembly protein FlgD
MLQAPATVQLSIYTQTGQLVRQITTGQLGAGRQQLEWNGRNSQDQPVANGIYFYRLLVNGTVRSGKLFKNN